MSKIEVHFTVIEDGKDELYAVRVSIFAANCWMTVAYYIPTNWFE